LRLPGERQRQPEIGLRDRALPLVEDRLGLLVFALRRLRERQAQRVAGRFVAQLHRVLERRFGRGEAPGIEVGRREDRAILRVVRGREHRGLGVLDRLLVFAAGERLLGLGGGKGGGRSRVGGAARQEDSGHGAGDGEADHAFAGCGVFHDVSDPLLVCFQSRLTCAAIASISGMSARNLSSAAVTSCCALRFLTVLASRNLRWRLASRRSVKAARRLVSLALRRTGSRSFEATEVTGAGATAAAACRCWRRTSGSLADAIISARASESTARISAAASGFAGDGVSE